MILTATHPDATLAEDALVQALERSDEERRPERAARIRWAAQCELTDYAVIMGSVEAMNLLREARECFVEGHFIATLALATALVEHVITADLTVTKGAKHGIEFGKAFRLARDEGLCPSELLDGAETLRLLRKPFSHHKPGNDEHALGNRYIARKRHPRHVVEDDARAALITMYVTFGIRSKIAPNVPAACRSQPLNTFNVINTKEGVHA